MDILKNINFDELIDKAAEKRVSISIYVEPGHTRIDIYPYNSMPAVWPISNPFTYGVDEGGKEE